MFRAIFWDNDGVLVDTERLFYLANKEVFELCAIALSKEDFREYYLRQNCGTWHWLLERGFSDLEIKALRVKRDAIYSNMLETVDFKIPNTEPVLKKLHKKYAMAVVTSSEKIHFSQIHNKTELMSYFDFVIYGEDCLKTKPDPEPYLKAMERVDFRPEECLVIEDSPRGVASAKAAGMQCCVIANELAYASECDEADYIVRSIAEIPGILGL